MRFIQDRCTSPITVEDVLERVARARTLLVQSRETIAQIARTCGFARRGSVGKMFKRTTTMTPGQYRQCFGHRHHGEAKPDHAAPAATIRAYEKQT